MDDHSRNLEDLLQNDSFVRWIRNCADDEEEAFWENWMRQKSNNRELVKEAQKILQAMQFKRVDTSDVEEELNKLNAQIDSEIPALQQTGSTYKQDKLFRYIAAAAVVLLIFSAGLFMLDQQLSSSEQLAELPVQTKIQEQILKTGASETTQQTTGQKWNKISTGFAEKTTLIFDDGSKVVLNAKSTLEYPAGDTEHGDIAVRLTGEAYFDIENHKTENKRTFSVHTKSGSVNVLGTKFSVQADAEQTEVALKEGVVEVKKRGNNAVADKSKYTMKPGEVAQFSKISSSIEVDKINPSVYFSWTQDLLRFDNTSLDKITQRIETTYGVDVIVSNRTLLKKKISGSIQNNDLDVLLDALSEILQTPIERTQNTITIGT